MNKRDVKSDFFLYSDDPPLSKRVKFHTSVCYCDTTAQVDLFCYFRPGKAEYFIIITVYISFHVIASNNRVVHVPSEKIMVQ